MLRNIMILLAGANLFSCQNKVQNNQPVNEKIIAIQDSNTLDSNVVSTIELVENKEGFKEVILDNEYFLNEMKYATKDNFLKAKIYPCAKCYLRQQVSESLINASKIAKQKGYKLIVFDCYRPLSLQKKMFEIVSNKKYVADPKKGSKHNRGAAVDVGLANEDNTPLDMGTEFDDFSEKAHYSNSEISSIAKNNRLILRNIMTQAGFEPYENEWWHFNFKNVDFPLSDFEWSCQ